MAVQPRKILSDSDLQVYYERLSGKGLSQAEYMDQKIKDQMHEYREFCGSVWLEMMYRGGGREAQIPVMTRCVPLVDDGTDDIPMQECQKVIICPENPCSWHSVMEAVDKAALTLWDLRVKSARVGGGHAG